MDDAALADRHCQGATARLASERVAALSRQLPDWQVEAGLRLRREFRFADFAGALAFVNSVGAEAESQGHHPDLELGWGRARVTFTTHDVGGLSEADFIMAARVDALHGG